MKLNDAVASGAYDAISVREARPGDFVVWKGTWTLREIVESNPLSLRIAAKMQPGKSDMVREDSWNNAAHVMRMRSGVAAPGPAAPLLKWALLFVNEAKAWRWDSDEAATAAILARIGPPPAAAASASLKKWAERVAAHVQSVAVYEREEGEHRVITADDVLAFGPPPSQHASKERT